jgi:hypothetical protein
MTVGIKLRVTGMLAILLTTSSVISLAEAPDGEWKNKAADISAAPASTKASLSKRVEARNVEQHLEQIAQLSEFNDWSGAKAQQVRPLYNPEGRQNAILWSVQTAQGPAGYLVTSKDGKHLYEFSRRSVPALPEELRGQELEGGYIYAGPMLHLVYYRSGSTALNLYNLQTGETLPFGELQDFVPAALRAESAVPPATEREVPRSVSPETDALYATGLFGKQKLGSAQTGALPLKAYAAGGTHTVPAYLVYDAVADKFYVTLEITKIITQGSLRYLRVHDPFSTGDGEADVYIDSRFPVTAFPLTASSATKSTPK